MKYLRIVVNGKEEIIVLESRNCKVCGNLFQPLKRKSEHCSNKCRRHTYRRENKDKIIAYKDKIRHGGVKEELITKFGLICSECGKQSTSFDIVAHHVTGDNQDHSNQILLCRSCHCRLHKSVPKKNVGKEQIEMAIKTTKNLDEACKVLGINRSSLYWKRKKFGLEFSEPYKHNLKR